MDNKKRALAFVGRNDYMAMEAASEKASEGYQIWFVLCDESVGICHEGPYCSKTFCRFCNYTMEKVIKSFMESHKDSHLVHVSDLITEEMRENAKKIEFTYNTVAELKNVVYKGVDIGYGAFSNFVSATRNVMPSFTPYFKHYINRILYGEVLITEALLRYHEENKFDYVIFHNGRFPNYKPAFCIARNNNIDYVATESRGIKDVRVRNFFYNTIPHSFKAINDKIEEMWEKGDSNKYETAKLFFENRYHSKPAGDKVYTKAQNEGELPSDFDKNKFNVVIFNSSEDEYFAIDKEHDEASLFPNQYVALKYIFDYFKEDSSVHFYLRIHPNLANVQFKSHLALYDLHYDNVTIIPPLHSVSSYALMEACNTVVVFNSTMGLECSYWGKPVIALSKDAYSLQDITYNPTTPQEALDLIGNRQLHKKEKPIENYLKVAYYYMCGWAEEFKYYPCRGYLQKMPLLPSSFMVFSVFKFCGSEKLQAFIQKCLEVLCREGIMGKYSDRSIIKNTK